MHTNRYSFTKPYINGEKTKWKQVVDFVVSSGPVTKNEIVAHVWPKEYRYCNVNGWCSTMFAGINAKQPEGVHYDKNLRKWVAWSWFDKNKNKQTKQTKKATTRSSKRIAIFDELNATINSGVFDNINTAKSDKKLSYTILVSNYTAQYASVTIIKKVDGKDIRFKIRTENGNSYFHAYIEVQTSDYSWKTLYNEQDIVGLTRVEYYADNITRLLLNRKNIDSMINFLNKVY